MKVKIRFCCYAALLICLLLPVRAYAIAYMSGPFDSLINKAEIIVKVQVFPHEKSPFEKNAFRAKIISILKSDGGPIPDNLSLQAASPIWPKDFGVPFEEKQVVLLVLRRSAGKLTVLRFSRAIMPATISKIDHKTGSTIQRKVFDELHAFLPQAKHEAAQALVLVHLSHLVSKTDEKIFLPFLKSRDKQLRRAALASLLRINPAAKRIQSAAADFEDHLAQKPVDYRVYKSNAYPQGTSDDYLFWEIYKDVESASQCGSYRIEILTARAKSYLPIYRALIDNAPDDYQRVFIGIKALKAVGQREDIHRLYKYINHKKAWIRHDVLEGIGRILSMEIKRPSIPSYMMPQSRAPHIKQWETKTQAAIEKALKEQGLHAEEANNLDSNSNALLELLFKDETPDPNEVEIKAIYGILYQRMLKQVDLDGIKRLVKQLGSDDKVIGKKALDELVKRVGLKQPVIESHGSIFPMTGTPGQVWGKYAENIEVAVNVKIPLIIKDLRSSSRKSWGRSEALIYLGESCPHPAFLSILKAIALDKKERLRMAAICSIAAIPHEGMIDFLIDRLTDKPIGIALNTYERLRAMTGAADQKMIVHFDIKKSWEGVDWQATKKNYKEWWKENKDNHDFSKRLPPMQHVGGM